MTWSYQYFQQPDMRSYDPVSDSIKAVWNFLSGTGSNRNDPAPKIAGIDPTSEKPGSSSTPVPVSSKPILKVFISYAREDYEHAKNIYDLLIDSKCQPWLDKFNLVPGQDWALEITESLDASDLAIVLFSASSVAKRGHIQVEYKHALGILDKMPANSIYVIPILVDECDPPLSFRKFHWVSLQELDWREQIQRAISHVKREKGC